MPRHFPAALVMPGDAFDIDRLQVMGRRVAGRSFAQGLVASLDADEQLTMLVGNAEERTRLLDLLAPILPARSTLNVVVGFDSRVIGPIGALHVPDPGLARWEVLRSGQPANSFSITGVIHTVCSSNVIEGLERLLLAPLEPWDALVCTSSAGRDVVKAAMDHQHEALQRRFGMSLPYPPGPELPLIPLAVEDALQPNGDSRADQRNKARQHLGIDSNVFVVLFLGRLSFHSKAHPLPIYRCLDRLISEGKKVLLIECGHQYNVNVAEAFSDLNSLFPRLPLLRLGGLQPASSAEKSLALAAADVFVSPADNLQETFGLSVIEAMSAELPAVVSDWDGYKDLVEDGVTGLRIPTRLALGPEEQIDSIDRTYRLGLLDYDTMVGLRSLAAVVEESPLYEALRVLSADPDLCQRMGVKARQRWRERFSWPVVQGQYRRLWDALADCRQKAGSLAIAPAAVSPTARLFATYATGPFQAESLVCNDDCTPASWLLRPMQQVFFTLLCGQALEPLIAHLEQCRSLNLVDLAALGIPPDQYQVVFAALVKLGICVPQPISAATSGQERALFL